jgi:hypothetical protein
MSEECAREEESNVTVDIRVERFGDGRLKLVVYFGNHSNFWKHSDDEFSWVPSKSEVKLIKDSLEALDTFNISRVLAVESACSDGW